MTTETQVVVDRMNADVEREQKRKAALMRAIGFDKLLPEQREIALEYARKYELDLILRHVVIVDGKPYVTRDAQLHIAHRSGQLDGYEVSDPVLEEMPGQGMFWRARCTVWRKDMTRPISLMGRYPAKGGNQRFAPEMAVKVAEVMTLRRAFDISAPAFEERWDIEQTPAEPEPIAPITDVIAATTRRIRSGAGGAEPSAGFAKSSTAGQDEPGAGNPPPRPVDTPAGARTATPSRSSGSAEAGHPSDGASEPAPDTDARCLEFSPVHGRCVADFAHSGPHVDQEAGTWSS
jgi:hypothetical protein